MGVGEIVMAVIAVVGILLGVFCNKSKSGGIASAAEGFNNGSIPWGDMAKMAGLAFLLNPEAMAKVATNAVNAAGTIVDETADVTESLFKKHPILMALGGYFLYLWLTKDKQETVVNYGTAGGSGGARVLPLSGRGENQKLLEYEEYLSPDQLRRESLDRPAVDWSGAPAQEQYVPFEQIKTENTTTFPAVDWDTPITGGSTQV